MKFLQLGNRQWLTLLTVVLLASCMSPRAHFYSLNQPARVMAADTAAQGTVVLGPLSIPQLVDRPQLVMHESNYEVSVNEQQRWAAPLKDQLMELLAAGLTDRLKIRRFVLASSAAINAPNARLSVDFSRLEMSRDAGVEVVVHWVYRDTRDGSLPIEGNAASHVVPSTRDYPAYVDALRQAGLAVAKEIAGSLSAESVRR